VTTLALVGVLEAELVVSAEAEEVAVAPREVAPRVVRQAVAGGVGGSPGDTLCVEVVGYTLRGYLNGALVLEGTDTDAQEIADGVPGLAARWANGNTSTSVNVKVWESWADGSI